MQLIKVTWSENYQKMQKNLIPQNNLESTSLQKLPEKEKSNPTMPECRAVAKVSQKVKNHCQSDNGVLA